MKETQDKRIAADILIAAISQSTMNTALTSAKTKASKEQSSESGSAVVATELAAAFKIIHQAVRMKD